MNDSNTFSYYRQLKPYLQFKTFIESLKRDDNKLLLESINKGINVIIEGAFSNQYKSDKDFVKYIDPPSNSIMRELANTNNYREIQKYIFGSIINLVDKKFPNIKDNDKAEEFYTRCISYAQDKNLIKTYKPSTGLQHYVFEFIIKPVASMLKNKYKDNSFNDTDNDNEENKKVIKPESDDYLNNRPDTSINKENNQLELQEAIKSSAEEVAVQLAEDYDIPTENIDTYINSIIKYINDKMEIIEIKHKKSDLSIRSMHISQSLNKTKGEKNPEFVEELENIEEERSRLPGTAELNKIEKQLDKQFNNSNEIWANFKIYAREEPAIVELLKGIKYNKQLINQSNEQLDTPPVPQRRVRSTKAQMAARRSETVPV